MTDTAKLRAQIAAGQYRVDAASIAAALLDHANIDAPPEPPESSPRAADPQREPERRITPR